jgi:hypothetical protein
VRVSVSENEIEERGKILNLIVEKSNTKYCYPNKFCGGNAWVVECHFETEGMTSVPVF